jgi:hypothetical protein
LAEVAQVKQTCAKLESIEMKTLLAVAVFLVMISFAGACFAQTQLVSDNFDGGINGTYLGPNWTGCGYNGGAYSALVYQNKQAGGAGYYSQECALYTGYGAFPSDQYATATVVAPTPSSTPQAAVQLRQNATPSTPESYIACGWNAQDFPADYHYRIWSMAPNPPTGGPTSLYLSTVTPSTNDVVWCQVLGTTVTIKVNGTTIATVTDTSGITSGYPGLYYIDPNGGAPPSNDVIFDNFVAGVIAAPPPPPPCTAQSSNSSNFNGTSIKSGSYIWFNANFTASGIPSAGATITLTQSTISFTAGGTAYNLAVPNAQITFSPSVTCTSTTFDTLTNTWMTTVPISGDDEIFLSGLSWPVPSGGLSGGINPVDWQGTFNVTTNIPGISINWKWGAAVYSSFTTNYNALAVKAAHKTACGLNNGDHAGTPEGVNGNNQPWKQFVVGGARGGGGSNWTGSWSGTTSVKPVCQ